MHTHTEMAILTFTKVEDVQKVEVKSRIWVSMGQCWILHSKFRSSVHFKEFAVRLQLIHGLVLLPGK